MIVDDLVLARGSRDRRAFVWRTVVAGIAIAAFAGIWGSASGIAEHPLIYAVFTSVIAYHVLVWSARWWALRRMARPRPMSPANGLRVAVVTTFVPEEEPISMLEMTLRAMTALEYPHDTWVLDEGDEPRVRALCEQLGVRHFSRRNRPGYNTPSGPFATRSKYGNYNAWLATLDDTTYDVLVAFDTDHIPEPHYLSCTLGYFTDERVAYVQAAPAYYNQSASFIARGAAEETFGYVSSHQMASYALGHPIIVGSHTLHRVAALREVGGFPAHDAEDLYMTMHYRARGWRGVYVPRILAMGTTPVDWARYLTQQRRWARAVLDLKFRLVPLAADMPPREQLLNLFHGVYFLRPLTFAAVLASVWWMLAFNVVPRFVEPTGLASIATLFIILGFVDHLRKRFYLDPLREGGIHWRAALLQLAKWPTLSAAMVSALARQKSPFATTTKNHSRAHRVLTPPHITVALLTAAAALYGSGVHGPLAGGLGTMAGIVTVASLALAWTEGWRYPPPFDPALWRDTRASMRDAIAKPAPVPLDIRQ